MTTSMGIVLSHAHPWSQNRSRFTLPLPSPPPKKGEGSCGVTAARWATYFDDLQNNNNESQSLRHILARR